MTQPDKLIVDYRDYEKPLNLPSGTLIEQDNIQVHLVDGRESADDRTYLIPRSFHAFSADSFEQQRDKALAAALQARIISIDIPGIGLNESAKAIRLPAREIAAGNLKHASNLSVSTVVKALELPAHEEIHLLGYSLGAWAATSIATSDAFREHTLRVASLNLVDAVNDQNWKLISLQHTILKENTQSARYKQESHANGFDTTQTTPALPSRTSILLGKGMTRGFSSDLAHAITEDMVDNATNLSNAPITLYRASESLVGRASAHKTTSEELRKAGHSSVRLVEFAAASEPHRHLFWHSIGAAALLASCSRSY